VVAAEWATQGRAFKKRPAYAGWRDVRFQGCGVSDRGVPLIRETGFLLSWDFYFLVMGVKDG
jgi:hypothetical protein